MVLDPTRPTDGDLESLWPGFERETRAEVNLLNTLILTGLLPGLADIILPNGDTDIDMTGRVGVSITMAAPPEALTDIDGGYSGQLMVLLIDAAEVGVLTLTDSAAIVLAEGRDFPMEANDFIFMINVGGVPGTMDGVWYEVARFQSSTSLPAITPNGTRVGLFIDNLFRVSAQTL